MAAYVDLSIGIDHGVVVFPSPGLAEHVQVAPRIDLGLGLIERHHGTNRQHPVHTATGAIVHPGVQAHCPKVLCLLEDVAPDLPWLAGRIALFWWQAECLLPKNGAVGDIKLDRLGGEFFDPLLDEHLGGKGVTAGPLECIIRGYIDLLCGSDGGLDREAPFHGRRIGDGCDLLPVLSLDLELQPVVVLPKHQCLAGKIDDFELGQYRFARQKPVLP